ncbi:hypothetical protein HY945_02505 [Candidatus Gottesmanbacteria bacterium]|nr:hypothetical protein [Candidatus Gottesmanbacteria bacterium]
MRQRQKNKRGIIKILLVWLIFIGYINLFSPSSILSFLVFYFLLSLNLLFTFKSFFPFGRSLLWTGIIIIYLILRQLHLDNIINTILMVSILITFEIYFRKT